HEALNTILLSELRSRSTLYTGKDCVSGFAIPGHDSFVVVLDDRHLKPGFQQSRQLPEAQCHHGVLILPGFTDAMGCSINAQPERLPFTSAHIMPARPKGKVTAIVPGGVTDIQIVVDAGLVYGIKTEQSVGR